jgi:hypothetical protein
MSDLADPGASLAKKTDVGFVMIIYQQRLARSFNAVRRPLNMHHDCIAAGRAALSGSNRMTCQRTTRRTRASDDSALTVLDKETEEEVAALAGRFQPSTFASHIDALGRWYNHAPVLVERNNHRHAVLLWLREHSGLWRLWGHDRGEGWLSSSKGKALLYDTAADAFRNGEATLHSLATFTQLASIEGSSLRAPTGEGDDRADAYALACVASRQRTGPYQIEGDLLRWPPADYRPSSEPRSWLEHVLAENGLHPWLIEGDD